MERSIRAACNKRFRISPNRIEAFRGTFCFQTTRSGHPRSPEMRQDSNQTEIREQTIINLPSSPPPNAAATVSGLYALAGNSQVPDQQRKALLHLRGDLVNLVALQFDQYSDAYRNVIANLNAVSGALDQAQQDIQRVTDVVTCAGQ